ncbi:unnamed protein product, partial [Effrenium voratum]
ECILPATRILLDPGNLLALGGTPQCFSVFIFLFMALLLFALLSSLLVLLRFLCLSISSAKSPGALEHSLAHRRRAKVHNYSVPGNAFFPFGTNVQRENVSGLAPALYFRYLAFQAGHVLRQAE